MNLTMQLSQWVSNNSFSLCLLAIVSSCIEQVTVTRIRIELQRFIFSHLVRLFYKLIFREMFILEMFLIYNMSDLIWFGYKFVKYCTKFLHSNFRIWRMMQATRWRIKSSRKPVLTLFSGRLVKAVVEKIVFVKSP